MASWAFLLRCQAGSLTRARAETARGPGAPALPREVEGRPAPRACRAEPRAGRGAPFPPGRRISSRAQNGAPRRGFSGPGAPVPSAARGALSGHRPSALRLAVRPPRGARSAGSRGARGHRRTDACPSVGAPSAASSPPILFKKRERPAEVTVHLSPTKPAESPRTAALSLHLPPTVRDARNWVQKRGSKGSVTYCVSIRQTPP